MCIESSSNASKKKSHLTGNGDGLELESNCGIAEDGDVDDSVDNDIAKYIADHQPIEIDAKLNKSLFWKANRRILVVMLGTYFCQSLDKGTLAFSSVMGIQKDADLVGQQYSWLGTILYMGVLAGEYPTNLLLQKLPLAKYLSVNVFCWGVVICCSAAANNFASLMVVRFLLGAFESCVQPAFIILTAMWYTKEEQALLTSAWYCQIGVQLMVGGLIAFGVSHYTHGVIKSWQLLFLVLGLTTCLWATFIGWYLPDSPMKAKCFTEAEKVLFIERVRKNETGIQNRYLKRYQMIEALKDPLVWCYVLLQLSSTLVIGGLGIFSNLVISSFGFTYLQTQLLNIAQGGVTIVVMVGSAALATKLNDTTMIMFILTIPALTGTAVIMKVTPTVYTRVGLLIAFYCTQFFLAEGNLLFSLISRNIAGQSKKSVTLTMTFLAWSAGNMAAPQIFRQSDAPRYKHGFIAHLCLYFVFSLALCATRFIILRRNWQLEIVHELDAGDANNHRHAFDDLTDRENRDFRYSM
ncbi:major facilitator superfamily domain-containing protein [Lipomyces kononenkoae]|uniref:Major facilitator superfamily domain-containing protein n=1 Tax=Lipomyces kononenkoae TaxID=34357 RepID=A0ACC3SUC0_LIPKO